MPAWDIGKKQYYSYLSIPIRNHHIFYESFSGLGVLDNPRAIFLQILKDPALKYYVHVWSVADMEMAKDNMKEFENLPNVKFVQRESEDYYRYLASASILSPILPLAISLPSGRSRFISIHGMGFLPSTWDMNILLSV